MLIRLIRYLQGYMKIRVSGYSPERFLNLCKHRRISLWGLVPANDAYEMYISVSGFQKLTPILKKTGTKVVILKKSGIPFFLHRYRKRKIFFFGGFFCLLLIYVFSLFIWDIQITGNYSQTDEMILEYLKSQDVRHGMRRADVDCPKIVRELRANFDDIIWVSASLEGSRLKIQVKENSDTIKETQVTKDTTPKDIIAPCDGKVSSIVTRKGTPQVQTGDEVKKGDILVLGRVDVLDDSKTVVDYQYQVADADIFLETSIPYENSIKNTYMEKEYYGIERKEYRLRIGKWILSFGSSKNDYDKAEIWCEKRQLKLGKHFELPIYLEKNGIIPYQTKEMAYADKEIQKILSDDFSRFCMDLKKRGVQILENDVKIYKDNGVSCAKGTLIVNMPASDEKQDTKILTVEQKENKTEGEP
ncbi:sporulation protein YqfD [Lachnoclostridium sp. An181]|uniref:sporulation protein YqfD n=1 Tax=Lachnoclostridium sp. An181 TaxID=1965575 RepID=UPI000B377BF2|nr:sporulation protein YqfD [Lachnoclostridium sp. An181]OUP50878.1 stage IV sporulation protein [Lachnoclostridium sp. An181]